MYNFVLITHNCTQKLHVPCFFCDNSQRDESGFVPFALFIPSPQTVLHWVADVYFIKPFLKVVQEIRPILWVQECLGVARFHALMLAKGVILPHMVADKDIHMFLAAAQDAFLVQASSVFGFQLMFMDILGSKRVESCAAHHSCAKSASILRYVPEE